LLADEENLMREKNKSYQRLILYYGLAGLILWNGILDSIGTPPVWARDNINSKQCTYKKLADYNLSNNPRNTKASDLQDKPIDQGPLVMGNVVVRDLQGGQSHRYRLNLMTNQYLDLIAEQQGVDVVLRLYGPDGKLLAEIDSPNGTTGPEPLPYITDVAGEYQVEIGSLEKDAPVGRYALKLINLRTATPADRQQLQLSQLEQDANLLSNQNKFKEAIATLEKAIVLRRQITPTATPELAEKINDLGILYYTVSNLNQAEKLFLEAREIWTKTLGADSLVITKSYNNLAAVYQGKGDFQRAFPEHQKALALREKILGPDHPDVAVSLSNLTPFYQFQGNYVKAEEVGKRALQIREKAFGADNLNVATSLNNLAAVYQDTGKYSEAEPLLVRALAIREKALGAEHPDVASSFNNLGSLYRERGDYSKATTLYQRALAIREKVFGHEHLDVATTMNNLALSYQDYGNYAQATKMLQEALAIFEKLEGKEHPDVAALLNNLGSLYQEAGDYRAAEPLFQRALAIYEKTFGREHPSVATAINNLALLYEIKADYQRAETLFRESLALREKKLGLEHPSLAVSLNNLGGIYKAREAYREAIPFYQRSLAIREKVLGPQHTDVAQSLNNLAVVYKEMGDRQQAATLYERALAIYERALGKENQPVAFVLSNLAEIYNDQGDYQRASAVLSRALEIREKIFGSAEHPVIATNLNSLAELALRQGQLANAISLQQRSLESREGELLRNLVSGSERQKLIYLKSSVKDQDFSVSLHLQNAVQNEQAAKLALTTILRRKGRALDVMTDSINRLRQQATSEDQQLLEELSTLRAQLSALVLRGPGKQSLADHQAQLKALETKIDALENRVSARSVEFRAQTTRVTLAAIQQAIPTTATLLEFTAYQPYDIAKRQFKPTHYAVYAINNQGELRWADLGEARKLEPLINQFRQQLRRKPQPTPQSLRRLKATSQKLADLLLQPLQDLITTNTQLLISPDGALNFVPFDALVDKQGKYLVERYAISYLTSGRDLLRLEASNPGQNAPRNEQLNNALVVANPFYGTGDGPVLGGRQAKALQQLAGAAQEAELISRRLPQAAFYTDEKATEQQLKQVKSPQILHIATHGYFLDKVSPVEASAQSRALEYTPTGEAVVKEDLTVLRSDNPLLRSWLFFAGANNAQTNNQTDVPMDVTSNVDDGILTALEASNLNLKGTKLVVLSACQTGLGEVESGEGVYGLRRALVLAGAESQLTSLWAIDDRATRDLMDRYYQLLEGGNGRQAALRQVQLEFLHKKLTPTSKTRKSHNLRSHPYYWAGFILSGEWGNLAGKR
jgi:CHAT domain-containing protein/lipopolysaccharide biosynthesis regulator YciM